MKTKIEIRTAHSAFSSSHACPCGPSLLLLLLLLCLSAPVRTAEAADYWASPSFAAARTFGSGGPGPSSVAVGDFNGDGKPDLGAVANAVTKTYTNTNAVGAGPFFYRIGVSP